MTPFQKFLSLFFAANLIQVSAQAASETTINWDNSNRVMALEGSLDYVVCLSSSQQLNVRDQTLSKVLFVANGAETVKPVQSFGTDTQEKVINGVTYSFMKVQFPNRSSTANVGWVAESYVKLRSQCVYTPTASAGTATKSGWTFPTLKRTTDSYKTGQRKFGSSRDGGARLHAAADLYRIDGETVGAVNSGTVIRDRYYFYLGTYALEVKHTGGRVVRYGEIKGKAAPGVSLGSTVQSGQTVGYMGTVNSGCCSPMLHFEMYSGTATGALTQSGNKYNRRSDLMDPTASLTEWEKTKFGTSY